MHVSVHLSVDLKSKAGACLNGVGRYREGTTREKEPGLASATTKSSLLIAGRVINLFVVAKRGDACMPN